jgi:hypothetical protein
MSDDTNREFAELVGICWHEWVENKGHDAELLMCKKCWKYPEEVGQSPDFCADPRLVLREMMKRDDWPEFCASIGLYEQWDQGEQGTEQEWMLVNVNLILDTTGKLRDAAIKFLRKVA